MNTRPDFLNIERDTRRAALVLAVGELDINGLGGLGLDARTCAAEAVLAVFAQAGVRANDSRGARRASLPIEVVATQLELVLNRADATKIAFVGEAEVAQLVSSQLAGAPNLVLDVHFIDRTERPMYLEAALDVLATQLLPHTTLVVLNHQEVEAVTGHRIMNPREAKDACRRIHGRGARNVLITGGRWEESHAVDFLYDGAGLTEFGADRLKRPGLRGPGDVLVASICARLGRGESLLEAVGEAKAAVHRSIERAVSTPWGMLPEPTAGLLRLAGKDLEHIREKVAVGPQTSAHQQA